MITTVSKHFKIFPLAVTLIGLVLATSSQIASAQQYKQIKRLGTSQAMCSGGIETAAELQEYFAANPAAVRAVIANSGSSLSADDLLAAVANGEMIERAYPVGTKMAWMGAKVKGEYVANPYREWAGAKSFEAFQVNVSSGCQVYQIAIPKACCNVSLISVEEDTSTACKPPVAAATVEEAPAPAPAPAVKEKSLIPYFALFAGPEVRPRYEVAWDMDMMDSAGVVGLRAGLMKRISDKTSVFGQISAYERSSINEGNVYPEDNIAVDVGVERKINAKAFIGGGIGIWNVDDSDFSDASLFGHVGANIGKSNFQWFLEGRVFDSDSENHDSIGDNRMVSAGIRYLVK
ncbi:MAG: hypothetical protein AAF431_01910 [Pseudomonadota bacterium]